MSNNEIQSYKKGETVYGEVMDDRMTYPNNYNNGFPSMQPVVNSQYNSFDRMVQKIEHANQRYWNAEFDRQGIINNEYWKYSNLKNQQDQLMSHINNANYPYGLWKFENLFYYRASPTSKLYKGNAEAICEAISSNYPLNVHIVSDLNNIPNNLKELKFDTIFLSIKSIISIEDEIIDTTQQYEIFQDYQGRFYRNLIVNTGYLNKRFFNGFLKDNESQTKCFIQKMTTFKESQFLLNRLGNFFKSLRGENLIVMVGNQDVSEGIFSEKVIRPMISAENYIIVTDDILEDLSIAEILKGKVLICINHIPEKQEHREKLKELLICVVINKSFQSENKTFSTYAQVIITIDKPNHFLKDFETLSDIFYIHSIEDILSELNIQNDVALTKVIRDGLMDFAEELVLIGETQWLNNQKSTDNEIFLLELDDVELVADVVSDTGLPILDPYSDSYEKIIPDANRFKHTYIIANQGYGKSQLITTLICRDIERNDCSVVLLDPHGELAEDLFKIIKDKERLVYIDFYLDGSIMPTINLFDSVEYDNEDSIYSVTQLIMSVLKNISSEDKLTGMMENTVENCISVMLREGGGSFWELYRFLGGTGSKDWLRIGKNSPNPIEADYFNNQFEKDTQTRDAVGRRLSKLIRDPKFSAFMNRQSTLNLEQLVNTKGKIIIFNIASGRMPNTYQYYMKFLIGYLQLIALKRVSIEDKEKRTYTQLYLDEFHLFLDKSNNLQEILTGARKYKMFLTFAHQSIAQIENSNLKEIVTTIPTRYFIGNIASKTLDTFNRALNIKLDNPEKQLSGEFYFQQDSNEPFQIQTTDRFLDGKENISSAQLEEHKQYELKTYYRPINQNTSSQQPTEDDLIQMIQQFKNDVKSVLSSKISIESSSLNNLSKKNSEKFDEIKSDITYFDTNKGIARPRIRQQEISTIFQMVFGLSEAISNRKFIALLKSENQDDLFNQTDSGTRLGDFTDNGKTQTEQYYYLAW
jgi:hypothetical protein